MFLCILVIVALSLAFPFCCQAEQIIAKPSFRWSEGSQSKSVGVSCRGYFFSDAEKSYFEPCTPPWPLGRGRFYPHFL
jgi:hypothetical protein